MKILFLTGHTPYPAFTGAKIRTFNLIKNLSGKNEITLLTIVNEEDDLANVKYMANYCTNVQYVFRKPTSKFRFYYGIFKNLFSARPFIIDNYNYQPYVNKIHSEIAKNKYDLVHCDSISLSLPLLNIQNVPRVLTEHNMESIIWQRYCQEEVNPLKKVYFGSQSKKVFKYEKTVCQAFDIVITVSEQDKRRLIINYKVDNVMVVANGVDIDYFKSINKPIENNTLVFTGSMDWRPNQDGILYFCKKIWPIVVSKKQNVSLWIVGRDPSPQIKALSSKDSRIVVTGTVKDVREYIDRSEIFIVPLRIGGGSRLKILQALAMKKPVVSTTIGAEGLEVNNGENILLADSPQDFADKIFQLFENKKLYQNLIEKGHEMVIQKYDWKIISKFQQDVWNKAYELKSK